MRWLSQLRGRTERGGEGEGGRGEGGDRRDEERWFERSERLCLKERIWVSDGRFL